jgi:hypothetical protein
MAHGRQDHYDLLAVMGTVGRLIAWLGHGDQVIVRAGIRKARKRVRKLITKDKTNGLKTRLHVLLQISQQRIRVVRTQQAKGSQSGLILLKRFSFSGSFVRMIFSHAVFEENSRKIG